MATLTRNSFTATKNQNLNLGAAEANATAVSSSDIVTNLDGKTMLFISNQGGSTDTVTIPVQTSTQYNASGSPITPSAISIAIATTERRIVGPISPEIYNDTGGNITIQHSFTTSVKIYCYQHPV
jgi:hypothetical protein